MGHQALPHRLFIPVIALAITIFARHAAADCYGTALPDGVNVICLESEDYLENPVCQNEGTLGYDRWCDIEGRSDWVAAFGCRCDCPIEWAGPFCTEIGAVCDPPYECQNGGTCIAHNKCECSWEWDGDQCTEVRCAPGCDPVNGYCESPGTCFCKGEATGITCRECKPGFYRDDDTGVCIPKQTEDYCDKVDKGAKYNPATDYCDCTPLKYFRERCDEPCPLCRHGFRQVGGCDKDQGPICQRCSRCRDGLTYMVGGCDGTAQDTICKPCTPCGPGTFYAGGCFNGENTFCTPCSKCPEGKFAAPEGCNGIDDTICVDCSTSCPYGLFPKKECTPENDLVCSACDLCPDGTEEEVPCTPTAPSVCKGAIRVPIFPSLPAKQDSPLLTIHLGVAPEKRLVLSISAMGLQITQGDRTNFNNQPDFADKEQSFDVIFEAGETSAEIVMQYHRIGYSVCSFEVKGEAGPDFVSLKNLNRAAFGLLDLPPGVDDVWNEYEVEEGETPVGEFDFKYSPKGKEVVFLSTSTWLRGDTLNEAYSCGIVNAKLSDTVTIPIALKGVQLTLDPFAAQTDPKDPNCQRLLDAHLQQLALTSSLTRTFLRAISVSMPDWMQLKVDDAKAGEAVTDADFSVALISGPEVNKLPNCESIPTKQDGTYAVVLWSKASIVIVDNEQRNVPANAGEAFCIAVDVSYHPGDVVFVHVPHAAWSVMANMPFKKKLDEDGWMLGRTSVGFSRGKNIDLAPVTRFWHGDGYFNYKTTFLSFWIDTTLTKELFAIGDAKSVGLKLILEIDGQGAIGVQDAFRNFDRMFSDKWEGFFEGMVALELQFNILKYTAKWRFEANGAIVGSFDGDTGTKPPERENCGELANPKGIFLVVQIDLSATGFGKDILDSAVGEYLGFGGSQRFAFDMFILYESVPRSGGWEEGIRGFGMKFDIGRICYFFGLCARTVVDIQYSHTSVLARCDRFKEVYQQLPDGYALSLRGTVKRPNILGFIRLPGDASVRLVLSTSSLAFVAQMQVVLDFLGTTVETNTFLGNSPAPFIRYNFRTKIFNIFLVEVDMQATLPRPDSKQILDWSTMGFYIKAYFIGDLIEALARMVEELLHKFARAAVERFEAVKKILDDIKEKLKQLESVIDRLKAYVDRLRAAWQSAIDYVTFWRDQVRKVKEPLEDARDKVQELQRKIYSICKIRDCGYICIPGCRWERRRRRKAISFDDLTRHAGHHIYDEIVGTNRTVDTIDTSPQLQLPYSDSAPGDDDSGPSRSFSALAPRRSEEASGTPSANVPFARGRTRRMLNSHPMGKEILLRSRRWGSVRVPKFRCSSCMWRIPDFPCLLANAICRAIRAPLWFLLKLIEAVISTLLAALEAIEKILDAAIALMEKAFFIFDLAEAVLEKAKGLLQVLYIAIDIAKAAVDVVKEAVRAALEFAASLFASKFTDILSIPRGGFELTFKGITPRRFYIYLDISVFKSSPARLSLDFDFGNIFGSLLRAASNLFDRFFGALFRRRRQVHYADIVDVHMVSHIVDLHPGLELEHVFHRRGVSVGHPSTYALDYETALEKMRARRDNVTAAGNSTDDVQVNSTAVLPPIDPAALFREKCNIFLDYSAFLTTLTDEIEDRYQDKVEFEANANKTQKVIEDGEADPTEHVPPVNASAFADDPVMDPVVRDYVGGLNTTEIARNSTSDESVVAAKEAGDEAISSSKNQTEEMEYHEYNDFLNRFSEKVNQTNALEPLGCPDVPDCIEQSAKYLVDLFDDVALEDHEDLLNMREEILALSRELSVGNITLTAAHDYATTLVWWINETMHRDIWCGEVPTITRHPQQLVTTLPEKRIELTCEVDGTPYPKVHWYRGENETNIVGHGETLVLDPVRVSDDGIYRCIAENHMSKAVSNVSQVLVAASSSMELIIRFQFSGENFTEEVIKANFSESFQLNLIQDLSMHLSVSPDRIASLTMSPSGEVSHTILEFDPDLPENENVTEPTVDEAVRQLRSDIRFGQFRSRFAKIDFFPVPTSFRRDFCRTPCLVVGPSGRYGEPCIPSDTSCPFGPGSCTFSCPAGYIFQSGGSQICRRSHEYSGYDGATYCRRLNDPPFDVRLVGNTTLWENVEQGIGFARVTAKDTDPTQRIKFKLVGSSSAVRVDPDGLVTLTFSPNYEGATSFSFTVRATDDSDPPFSTDAELTVNVADVNEPPRSLSIRGTTSINENTAVGTSFAWFEATDHESHQEHTFTLLSNPGGLFSITNGYVLTLANEVDYEAIPNGKVTINVQATDDGVPKLSNNATFEITIKDINENPTLNYTCQVCIHKVDSTMEAGTVLGRFFSSDPDQGQTTSLKVTDDLSGGIFEIINDRLVLKRKVLSSDEQKLVAVVLAEDDVSRQRGRSDPVRVEYVNKDYIPPTTTTTTTTTTSTTWTSTTTTTSTSEDAPSVSTSLASSISGSLGTATPALSTVSNSSQSTTTSSTTSTTTSTSTTTEGSTANYAPSLLYLLPSAVAEGEPAGSLVGVMIVEDQNWNQYHTFALDDDADGAFKVIGNGLYTTRVLDFEDMSSYTLRISATDNSTNSMTSVFRQQVQIINANDPPHIVLSDGLAKNFTIPEGARLGVTLLSVSIDDEDWEQTHTTTLTDHSGGYFGLRFGEVTLEKSIDETTPRELSFTLTTRDTGIPRLTDTLEVTLSVVASDNNNAGTPGSSGTGNTDTTVIIAGAVVGLVVLIMVIVIVALRMRYARQQKLAEDRTKHESVILSAVPMAPRWYAVNDGFENEFAFADALADTAIDAAAQSQHGAGHASIAGSEEPAEMEWVGFTEEAPAQQSRTVIHVASHGKATSSAAAAIRAAREARRRQMLDTTTSTSSSAAPTSSAAHLSASTSATAGGTAASGAVASSAAGQPQPVEEVDDDNVGYLHVGEDDTNSGEVSSEGEPQALPGAVPSEHENAVESGAADKLEPSTAADNGAHNAAPPSAAPCDQRSASDASSAVQAGAAAEPNPQQQQQQPPQPRILPPGSINLPIAPRGKLANGDASVDGRKAAVTVMVVPLTASADDRRMAFKEAALLAQIQSRFVVGLIGLSMDQQHGLLMALDRCENGPLEAALISGRLSDKQLLQVAHGCAQGVAHLHNHGVFLGTVSCRRVLLDKRNTPKFYMISDQTAGFGPDDLVARYQAPEQLQRHAPPSAASDCWGLAMLLHEIFSGGESPYASIFTAEEVLENILDGIRPGKSHRCPGVVFDTMVQLWKRTPTQRLSAANAADRLATAM